jgi:uncharacterized alkaline shock family protein YloU
MAVEMMNDLGRITVADGLVEKIAGYATVENYGIVGMNARKGLDLFSKDSLGKGVKVTILSGDVVDIDLYVTLEYGVSLPAVARNTKANVKYRVEEMTGLKVNSVNVHVVNVRV